MAILEVGGYGMAFISLSLMLPRLLTHVQQLTGADFLFFLLGMPFGCSMTWRLALAVHPNLRDSGRVCI